MRLLITCGATREDLDDVRYLTNRSSGRMGWALAWTALRAGHEVEVVAGPTEMPPPPGLTIVPVRTAEEMADAALDRFARADAGIFAAAVADYRPAARTAGKWASGETGRALALAPTRDILATACASKGDRPVMGFALEPGMDEAAARVKRDRKGCDWIVLNDPSALGAAHARVIALGADDARIEIAGSKGEVAARLLPLLAGEGPRAS